MSDVPPVDPLPVPGESGRRTSVAVVLAIVVFAVLLCCACSVGSVFIARSAFENVTERFESGMEFVAWSGDGRFALIQSLDADGKPLVAAWERETGEVRVESGYQIAAVEPFGATVWLLPEDDQAEAMIGMYAPALDAPPGELFVWDMGEEGPVAVPAGEATWLPWPGPADWIAEAHTDTGIGIFPSGLTIEETSSAAAPRTVELPSDLNTFEFLGWSPSGRYLAIVERLPADDFSDLSFMWPSDETYESDEWSPEWEWGTSRVLVIDAETAELVSETGASTGYLSGTRPAAWHSVSDVLIVSTVAEEFASPDHMQGSVVLMALEPNGVPIAADRHFGFEVPGQWGRAWELQVIGSGPRGTMILADSSIWFLDDEGVSQAGHLPYSYSTSWHPDAGILTLDQQWSDRDASTFTVVSLFDERGGSERVVWEGPQRSVSLDGW